MLAVEISSPFLKAPERFGALGLEMPSLAKPSISAYSQGASCQGGGAGLHRSKARGAENCIKAQKAQIKVPWFEETRCLVSWDW